MNTNGPAPTPRNPGQVLPTLPRQVGSSRPGLLPTLEGMTHGIVGMDFDEDRRRNVYTIQCDGCFALETPTYLVLMKTKFNSRHPGRRLCPTCQTAAGWPND